MLRPVDWPRCGLHESRLEFCHGQEISLALKRCRAAKEPTPSAIQLVQGIIFRGQNGRCVRLTTHLHLLSRLWMSGAILTLPSSW